MGAAVSFRQWALSRANSYTKTSSASSATINLCLRIWRAGVCRKSSILTFRDLWFFQNEVVQPELAENWARAIAALLPLNNNANCVG